MPCVNVLTGKITGESSEIYLQYIPFMFLGYSTHIPSKWLTGILSIQKQGYTAPGFHNFYFRESVSPSLLAMQWKSGVPSLEQVWHSDVAPPLCTIQSPHFICRFCAAFTVIALSQFPFIQGVKTVHATRNVSANKPWKRICKDNSTLSPCEPNASCMEWIMDVLANAVRFLVCTGLAVSPSCGTQDESGLSITIYNIPNLSLLIQIRSLSAKFRECRPCRSLFIPLGINIVIQEFLVLI